MMERSRTVINNGASEDHINGQQFFETAQDNLNACVFHLLLSQSMLRQANA